MGSTTFGPLVLGFLAIWAATADSAGHQAAAPAVDCNSVVLNLADCLPFVTSGSTAEEPEGRCCSGLKTVLKSNAECLCEGFEKSAQLGMVLNVSRAMSLPAACRLSAPSATACPMSSGSISSPAPSPLASPPGSTAAEPPGDVIGVNTVTSPTPSRGTRAASSSSERTVHIGSFSTFVILLLHLILLLL
ncbi:hypothetical protein DM860_012905 [Cuscuta australis]|uniref:Bifunctional inhibitor/plant lipid transfer protein/seed storage helical domain-containing protein n=1 Tax=Cuscuta australis TaxID=267555 RepID=A0A328DUY3_9ASTE|nr:hypothetical protein DM860_012905 [Cuscuta australis]